MASELSRPPEVAVSSPGSSRPPLLSLSPNTAGHPLTAGSSPGPVHALKASPLTSGACEIPASCVSPVMQTAASGLGSAVKRNTPSNLGGHAGPASHAIASMCFDEDMLNAKGLLSSVSCLTGDRTGGVHDSIAQFSWQDRMGRNTGTADSSLIKSATSSEFQMGDIGSSLDSSSIADDDFMKDFSGEGLQDESIALDSFRKVPSPTDSANVSAIDFDSIAAEAENVSNDMALDLAEAVPADLPPATESTHSVDFVNIAAEAAFMSNGIACTESSSPLPSGPVQPQGQSKFATPSKNVHASIQLNFDSMAVGDTSLSLDLGQDSIEAEEQLKELEAALTPRAEQTATCADDDVDLDEAVEMAELLAAQFERAISTQETEPPASLAPPLATDAPMSDATAAAAEQLAQSIVSTALEHAIASAGTANADVEPRDGFSGVAPSDCAHTPAESGDQSPVSVKQTEKADQSVIDTAAAPPSVDLSQEGNPAEQTAITTQTLPLSDDELAEEFVAALDLAASLAGCDAPPAQTQPAADVVLNTEAGLTASEIDESEKEQWLSGHTNDVYGSDMRGSVQVTSISSVYEAKTGTPVLAPLDEEEVESHLSAEKSPTADVLPALTPSAEGPETSRARSLTPEADLDIMETFLQKFSISTPIQQLAVDLEEAEVPATEVMRPTVRESSVFYSPRATAQTPKDVQATVAVKGSTAPGSPDGEEAFYSPEERSPVARCALQDDKECPPTEPLEQKTSAPEQNTEKAEDPSESQQVGGEEPSTEAKAEAVDPANIPLPPCSMTLLAHIPEDESAEVPMDIPAIPSFWGGFCGSGLDMDSSMVVYGSINMAVRESTYAPTTSGFKDALDVEDKAAAATEGGANEVKETASQSPMKTPDFQSIVDDAAAVAQSLEENDNLKVKANLFGSSETEASVQQAKPTAAAAAAPGNEFTLGKASPPHGGGSRLRAPRSAYNFFDKAHVSKSVDELFKVSTPARFRFGAELTGAAEPSSEVPQAVKGSAAKNRQDRTLFPGGMSCPGPIFGFGLDDEADCGSPPSPSSWLFPVHPLAKAAGDKPLKLYSGTRTPKPAYTRSYASSPTNSADNLSIPKGSSGDGDRPAETAHQKSASVAQDAPLKSHRVDAGRTMRRVRRSGGTSTSQSSLSNSATSITGSTSSAPRAGMPPNPTHSEAPAAPKPAVPARIRTSHTNRSSGSHAAFAAVTSASQSGGILYVENRSSSAAALAKPTGGTAKMQKMFSKGVSRLKKPSSFGKQRARQLPPVAPVPAAATAAELPGPAAAPEEGQVKRLFSWKAMQTAATPAGPGKRRRKCQEEDDLVPETPRTVNRSGLSGAIMKMVTPLSGFKKNASKFLSSSPTMNRQPDFE